jgi:hypothetical protein
VTSANILDPGWIFTALVTAAVFASLVIVARRSVRPEISELTRLRRVLFRAAVNGVHVVALLMMILISLLVVNSHKPKPLNFPWGFLLFAGLLVSLVSAACAFFGRGLSRLLRIGNAALLMTLWLMLGLAMSP